MLQRLYLMSATLLVLLNPVTAQGQDSSRVSAPDSARIDSMFRGPHYRFSGSEDPALLVEVFRQTLKLGKQDAGGLARPAVLCLGIGRDSVADVDRTVLTLMAKDEPPVLPHSACIVTMNGRYTVTEKATGKRAWLLGITALIAASDSVVAYSDFYVGPLFAAGWACAATRSSSGWVIKNCTMRWIS